MAVPTLPTVIALTLTKNDCKCTQAAEMKVLHLVSGCTLRAGKRNYIRKQLDIFSINEKKS